MPGWFQAGFLGGEGPNSVKRCSASPNGLGSSQDASDRVGGGGLGRGEAEPHPGLLVLDASRLEAEANLMNS